MKSSSTTNGIASLAAPNSLLRSLNRKIYEAYSIDPCSRVPKNSKYTELQHYFTVYVCVLLHRVILIIIKSSQPSRASKCMLKTCNVYSETITSTIF